MALSCLRSEGLLTRALAGRADEAERIEIESHLERCAPCRVVRDRLRLVGKLSTWEPPRLSDAARDRARRAALDGARAARPEPSRRGWPLFVALAGVGVAAALALSWARLPESRILDGDITADARRGIALDDGARVGSGRGGRVTLGGPVIELGAGTALTWHAAARTVELERGRVTVDVDPRQGKPYRIHTAHFSVEVLGTRFEVALDGVRTERGRVRVFGADGVELATLTAGQSWALPPPLPSLPPAPPPVAVPAPPPIAPVVPPHAPPAAPPADDGRARLLEARNALSRGDASDARGLLHPLLRGRRTLAAEANALYAESFLVEGRYAEAIAGYRRVARQFAGTEQAESAFYAVAQLALESEGRDQAARALTAYLERYPHGRFVREARQRLDRLTVSPSP